MANVALVDTDFFFKYLPVTKPLYLEIKKSFQWSHGTFCVWWFHLRLLGQISHYLRLYGWRYCITYIALIGIVVWLKRERFLQYLRKPAGVTAFVIEMWNEVIQVRVKKSIWESWFPKSTASFSRGEYQVYFSACIFSLFLESACVNDHFSHLIYVVIRHDGGEELCLCHPVYAHREPKLNPVL